jgi:hypothetical protein
LIPASNDVKPFLLLDEYVKALTNIIDNDEDKEVKERVRKDSFLECL